jgi:hypothetical protein
VCVSEICIFHVCVAWRIITSKRVMLGRYLSGTEAKYRIHNNKYPYKHDIMIHT